MKYSKVVRQEIMNVDIRMVIHIRMNWLNEIFQMGIEYIYNKKSAGTKMCQHLQQLYPDCSWKKLK